MTLVYLLPVALVTFVADHEGRATALALIVVLLALPVFYVGHYVLLQHCRAGRADAALPQQFRLLGFDIIEPDTRASESAGYLLWVNDADSDQPRVHRLTYRKDLHQELVAAGQRQAEGRTQLGTRSRQAANASSGQAGIAQEIISFSDATPRSLPAKTIVARRIQKSRRRGRLQFRSREAWFNPFFHRLSPAPPRT